MSISQQLLREADRYRTESDERMILPFVPMAKSRHSAGVAPPSPEPSMTLRQFYETQLLPTRQRRIKLNTKKADFDALSAWEKTTDNVDLRSLDWSTPLATRESLKAMRAQLQKFVLEMQESGSSPSTINKRLRHIRTMLRKAADPIDHALLSHVPDLGTGFTGTNSAWRVRENRSPPRAIVTADEMTRLFYATSETSDPHLWKVIILLLWTYGARTEDAFFGMTWDLIDFRQSLLRFTAQKTSKLQGVPLTKLVIRALESLRNRRSLANHSESIFGVIKRGTWTVSKGWVEGYYTTWSRDILPAARISVNRGPAEFQAACNARPGLSPNILFHDFRKCMVTELNIYSTQAGNWVAAHYMPGVSEQFYDTPTERIATSVAARESERLPECFYQYFAG